jgi:hypothetical protein
MNQDLSISLIKKLKEIKKKKSFYKNRTILSKYITIINEIHIFSPSSKLFKTFNNKLN